MIPARYQNTIATEMQHNTLYIAKADLHQVFVLGVASQVFSIRIKIILHPFTTHNIESSAFCEPSYIHLSIKEGHDIWNMSFGKRIEGGGGGREG